MIKVDITTQNLNHVLDVVQGIMDANHEICRAANIEVPDLEGTAMQVFFNASFNNEAGKFVTLLKVKMLRRLLN